MTFEPGPIHVTYSPMLLLAVAVVVSGVLSVAVAMARRMSVKPRTIVGLIAISPVPMLFLARAHFPGIAPSVVDYCFGELGVLHVLSLLLPPVVGFSTLAILKSRRAEAHV